MVYCSFFITLTSCLQIKTHRTTLPESQSEVIINHVLSALDNAEYKMEKDFATYVKKKCDAELSGTWHVVAGRNFGCSITHDTKYVLFFQVDQMHFLIFKSLE